MSVSYTYIQAIGAGWPDVGCHTSGTNNSYSELIWDSGDPIPAQEDLDSWIIEQIKIDMWRLIQGERNRRKFCGVKVGDYWFHTDDTSRIQQIGLVMFGANMPPNIMWKTMTTEYVLMTPTLAQQIFQAVAISDMTIFAISEQKRQAMLASQDPGSYDWESGWPIIYGE